MQEARQALQRRPGHRHQTEPGSSKMTAHNLPDGREAVKVDARPSFQAALSDLLKARSAIAALQALPGDTPGLDDDVLAATEAVDVALLALIASKVTTPADLLEKVRIAHEIAEDGASNGPWFDGRLTPLLAAIRSDVQQVWHAPRTIAA